MYKEMITVYWHLSFHTKLKFYGHTVESIMFDTDESYDDIHRDFFCTFQNGIVFVFRFLNNNGRKDADKKQKLNE